MTLTETKQDISGKIERYLPYLRRYARALTGTQASGDAFAAATLKSILHDRTVFNSAYTPRVALFRSFHLIWTNAGAPVETPSAALERAVQTHIQGLTPNSREALLLNTIEVFSAQEIAQVMGISANDARELIDIAHCELERSASGKVLVIEDEAIIAMDIRAIVTSMGHTVTGIGRTQKDAVALGLADHPDLILADIQLADDSSGIDAVNDLLQAVGDIPVIFITAFPERLLMGDRLEPAFLISKPYSEEQVRSAVSQAMFFSSTATLEAQAEA